MPGLDGFEVMRAAGSRPPRVVFVTAHAGHALEAFDTEAVDYVLKPFDDDRFARALSRAKAAARADRTLALAARLSSEARTQAAPAYLERIVVPDREGVRVVPVAEIDWIEAQDYYVELHIGSRSYLLRRSLKLLEERLDPRQFARVHRSALVQAFALALPFAEAAVGALITVGLFHTPRRAPIWPPRSRPGIPAARR